MLASTLGGAVKKNVLGELLTASNCSGCPIANRALDHYLDPTHGDYVGDELAGDWILIRFPVSYTHLTLPTILLV